MSLLVRMQGRWTKCNAYVKTGVGWKEIKNIYTKLESGWKPIWKYTWDLGGWSDCSANCGGGTQTRPVRCVRNDGVTKNDQFCTHLGSKPENTRTCNTQPCDIPVQELRTCNQWSRLYFNDGRPVAHSGVMTCENVDNDWMGPGYYYIGIAILFTVHVYKGYLWAELTASARKPAGGSTPKIMLSTRNRQDVLTVSGTFEYDGTYPWQGTRQDLVDGDGSDYTPHLYRYDRYYFNERVYLSQKPLSFFIDLTLTGDTWRCHDGRMCSEYTYIKFAKNQS